MLCYLRALLFKNSWYHYVILQRWGVLMDICLEMPSSDQSPPTRVSLILRLRNPDEVRAWQEFAEIYQGKPRARQRASPRGT